MATPETGGPTAPTAVRMRTLRIAEGYGNRAKEWAAKLGITPSRLSNIENGLPLSSEVALLTAKKVPGVTLDWLYLGKLDAVPLELRQRLQAAEEAGKGTRMRSESRGG